VQATQPWQLMLGSPILDLMHRQADNGEAGEADAATGNNAFT
jgi:hypothetical protein